MAETIKTDSGTELLLICSKPLLDSEDADKICSLVKGGIDWVRVLRAARSHGVWLILYHNLKSVCPEAVPPDIFQTLKKTYLFNARRNIRLCRELLCIIEDFRKHGIETVPFKGPALAQMAYGDVTLRSFSDLDIMVRRRNVLKAKDLLIGRGYEPQSDYTPLQERLQLQNACEYNFVRNDPSIPLEVHWMFHPSIYKIPFDEGIWSRLETTTFEGTTVLSFPAEDLVLALSAHAARHHWDQIKHVSDLAGLVGCSRIDWDRVMASAANAGLMRILHINLHLAHDLLGLEYPSQMESEIERDTAAGKLASHLSLKLFAEPERENEVLESLFWLKTQERLRDKARYLLLLGTNPSGADLDTVSLPENLYSLYRIIRPARLICRYGLKKRWI